MTKIMLVEDDKSLREIYGVRLLAEGYDIVSAGDGEEALAMAIKERPRLIVSDVMMPKVSGYDMLDILRSTTETKNIRVIMMTALSSEEQRMRAESLGADRYLVKSQVGIEDVVRVVHEVLEDTPETVSAAATRPVAAPAPRAATPPVPETRPAPAPASPVPAPQPVAPSPIATPTTFAAPAAPAIPTPPVPTPAPKPLGNAPKPASLKTRIIQPLHDPSIAPVNINDLLDKELAKEAGLTATEIPVVETVDQEKAAINEQLKSFIPPEPTPVEAPNEAQTTPVTIPSPSLLPTPGVGGDTPGPSASASQQPPIVQTAPSPDTVNTPAPAPSVDVPPISPVAPVPTPPLPPAPPTPPVPTVTATPTPTTAAIPATPPVIESQPPEAATLTPSSDPVIDLTKLPEVPKVSDTPVVQ